MVCIYCGNPTSVTNSRPQRQTNQVWRRRACTACSSTFTTHEAPDLAAAIVVQHSQRDVRPFNRDFLFVSVYESCKHRQTPIQDAHNLTQTIVTLLKPHISGGVILREQIITIAAEVLSRYDKTAAAVYSAFHKA